MKVILNKIHGLALLTLAGMMGMPTAGAKAATPNILFCVADDWGYGHAGAYGCRWVKTPAFDRVASGGILFSRAYTPNAKCAPSRACILTGRNSWQLKAACNHWCFFPAEFKTYAEALAENGYFVGYTAKGWAPGIANDAAGKPRNLTGKAFNKRTLPPPTKEIGNNDYAGNFGDFLEATPKGKPWCFWYGAVEPHRGYEYGSGVAKGGKKTSDVDRVPAFWPDNEVVRNDMLDYAFEVEHYDRHLGRMLETLENRGLLQDTLIVVTADHGMPFPRAKGQEYEYSNHIPLAIMWQKQLRNPGRVVDDYVSFIDLAPTFLEVAGVSLAQSGMQPITGRSLTELFNSDKSGRIIPERNHVLIGKERHDVGRPNDWGYPIRGIIKNDLLYLQNFETNRWPAGNPETGYLNCDGGATKTEVLKARHNPDTKKYWDLCFGKRKTEEMFNLKKDRECMDNLAGNPEHRTLQTALKQQLFDELKAQADPRMLGQGHTLEAYPYADPTGYHFYERFIQGEKVKAGWVTPTDFEKGPIE